MQTTNVQVNSLFGNDVQYIIPLFQRHYVWGEAKQWAPLWKDINDKACHRLYESQRDQSSHFTGAIVIQQKQTNVDEVQKYEIIDGQQRLTTFQIVLCALRDVCNSCGFERIGAEATRYILNQGTLLDDPDNEKYKLIPTEFDRASFISLTDGSVDDSSGRIRLTYNYFKKEIDDYVNRDRNKTLALFRSILNDFGFVQILLDAGDEPERIFESLNTRAESLLEFDSLRNNLFLRARIEQDRDRLYREHWKHFETPYWAKIVMGNQNLSERFFQHFIMAKLGKATVTPLFNVYQRELAGIGGVEHELSELKKYSEAYQEMIDCSPESEIGAAMSLYRILKDGRGITTLHPFILFVINELGVSGSSLSIVLQILESYTLRRELCIPNAFGNYNKFFSGLIRKLKGRRFDLGNFIKLLSAGNAKSTKWPRDFEVGIVLLLQSPIMNRTAIRYILYRIELKKREGNQSLETNELIFDNSLSLEHIMPEGWQNTWSLPLVTEENGEPSFDCEERIFYEELFHSEYRENNPQWRTEASEDGLVDESYRSAYSVANQRRDFLQSIGNLTLVTKSLNSSLSNRPFSEKKVRLFQNSLLVLNREICEHDTWDVPQITQRAGDLRDYFCSIWPSPEHFAESIGEPL